MNIAPKTRAFLLGTSLIATLIASFAPEDPPPQTSPAVRKTRPLGQSSADRTSAPDEIPAIAISRPEKARLAGDPFSNSAWQPPPAAPAKSDAPPPPPPPQQPFTYLGRLNDSERQAVLLGRGETSITVRAGETVDGAWRVDAINADAIELIHLPTTTHHTLTIRRAS